mmetsp:Transcript_23394/g.55346  ORF Transcript_23394/g.55346 Transcript_23394/m.55346 type:complete len:412 (+) Transcript_23394:180-1415(+)
MRELLLAPVHPVPALDGLRPALRLGAAQPASLLCRNLRGLACSLCLGLRELPRLRQGLPLPLLLLCERLLPEPDCLELSHLYPQVLPHCFVRHCNLDRRLPLLLLPPQLRPLPLQLRCQQARRVLAADGRAPLRALRLHGRAPRSLQLLAEVPHLRPAAPLRDGAALHGVAQGLGGLLRVLLRAPPARLLTLQLLLQILHFAAKRVGRPGVALRVVCLRGLVAGLYGIEPRPGRPAGGRHGSRSRCQVRSCALKVGVRGAGLLQRALHQLHLVLRLPGKHLLQPLVLPPQGQAPQRQRQRRGRLAPLPRVGHAHGVERGEVAAPDLGMLRVDAGDLSRPPARLGLAEDGVDLARDSQDTARQVLRALEHFIMARQVVHDAGVHAIPVADPLHESSRRAALGGAGVQLLPRP